MLTNYDYLVITFYFVFMAGMGWFFRNFSKNASDFFRGGGQMTWWLVGASAFMSSFSAWTFTGAASIAYEFGIVILVIYLANAIGFFLNFTTFGPWFRQMRVITVMQAIRQRFDPGSEQFFTWLQLPIQILYAAIWLFGLAVFAASVFGMSLQVTIVVTGLVVLLIATMGGSWAVVAGDFLQALILMPITVVVAVLALVAVGGVGPFFEQIPPDHLDLLGSRYAEYGLLWVIAMVIKQIIILNNMQDAARYLCVKDGGAARKAAMLSTILFLVGPVIWFIPPMAARILYPDLAAMFPSLKNPAEGAYVAIAMKTMPAGLLGLLVTGIFSATMSSMDTGLNRNAGVFIKNVYQPFMRPHASEKELLMVGKIITAFFGIIVILTALVYSTWENVGLFKLMISFSALVSMPYSIPLFWCLIIRRTAPWAAWSTVLVCLLVSLLVSAGPSWAWVQSLAASTGLTPVVDWARAHDFVASMAANTVIGSAWFLGSCLFYKNSSEEYKRRSGEFFAEMHRPVDFAKEIGEGSDSRQASALSKLCVAYGAFVSLLVLIPNPISGRLSILFCGGTLLFIGWLLGRSSKRSNSPAE
jgi:SSS family solute:Na+ symporter